MRKLILSAVATAMLTVTGASANSCNAEKLKMDYKKYYKGNQTKIENILKSKGDYGSLKGAAKGSANVFELKYGSLQNNITNLQLPTSTLSIVNNWESVFFKIYSYMAHSKNEKELYYRLSKLAQYLLPSMNSSLLLADLEITLDSGNTLGSNMLMGSLEHKNKEARQNVLRSFIIFSLIADPTADDSFAKKYFSKHDEVLNCVKQAIGL